MLLLGWKCWEQSQGSLHTSAEGAQVDSKARKQHWEQSPCGSWLVEECQVIWGFTEINPGITRAEMSQAKGEEGIPSVLLKLNCMFSRNVVL